MTLKQFVDKYLGKKVDFDGYYAGQCVDLFRQYIQDVLGFPQPKGVSGAADFWTNYDTDTSLKQYYDKIKNTPEGVPEPGDVMLWNKRAGGGFGHVAIFLEGNANQFTSLDQNWPTLSVVTKTIHDYSNLYGWLRPKKEAENCETKLAWYEAEYPKEQQRVIDARTERDAIKADYDNLTTEYNRLKEDSRIQIQSVEDVAKAQKQKYEDFIGEVASRLLTTQDPATILPTIDRLVSVEDQLGKARKEIDQNQNTIAYKDGLIGELKTEVERLREEARKAKGLGDAKTAELIDELIKRLVAIIKK